jgi:hypothetical protein
MTEHSIHEELTKKAFNLSDPSPFASTPINGTPAPVGQLKSPKGTESIENPISSMDVDGLTPYLDAVQDARQTGNNEALQQALQQLREYQDSQSNTAQGGVEK